MAGFPPRFGTGMSPMAGTQPIAPTPTLPGLQPPMGGVPSVGAPIPLSSSNSGIAGYGGSSSGRDKFSKYLQQMNTSAPLAMNRGGPVPNDNRRLPAAKIDGDTISRAAMSVGLPTDNATLNMLVNLINKGYTVKDAASEVKSRIGGPVKMRHGGIVEASNYSNPNANNYNIGIKPSMDYGSFKGQPKILESFLPPMDLGRPQPNFGGGGGYGGGGGIQGALQPLSSYITTQLQQQANQEVGPFIDEVAGNAQETFGLQSGGGMTAIAQPAITRMPSFGISSGGSLMPFNPTKIPFNTGNNYGNALDRGVGPFAPNTAVPMAQGGAVPRQTMIEEQPHMLAYIDPQEQSMLRQMGGSGQPGPGGVPAYARRDGPGSENFGSEARDFREELEEREAEQNRNDADDRAAAEAALRAATEQRIAAQYPSADEIEVMNTAGYDKEPTQYPTASRDSYAGLVVVRYFPIQVV